METLTNIFYMYSNMNKSSQILLFLIVLVGLMLLSILIINVITNKRNKQYDAKYNPIDRYTNAMKSAKPKISENKKQEVLSLANEEPVKEEIEKLPLEDDEDLEVIEIISDDNSIDKISELLEDNINNLNPIDLTKFEEEQEKNAIISYDELVKKAGAKKIVYKTEKATINEERIEPKLEIKTEPKEEAKSHFKASQVISPIYGVQKNKMYPKNDIEEFIDIDDEDLDRKTKQNEEDMKKDLEFLNSLKTFRSEL